MANGDNNNLAARSYSKDFKTLMQAVFATYGYFSDFFGGGMENVTVGQIAAGIALIAGLIGGGKLILNSLKDGIARIVETALAPLTA